MGSISPFNFGDYARSTVGCVVLSELYVWWQVRCSKELGLDIPADNNTSGSVLIPTIYINMTILYPIVAYKVPLSFNKNVKQHITCGKKKKKNSLYRK